MNLFSFNKSGPIKDHDDKYNTNITGRRWSFFIEPIKIGFMHEVQYRHEKWHGGVGYYIAGIYTNFEHWLSFGHSSTYYDGTHNVFALGPFFVSWLS